jgi:hypothetical protein
MDASEGVMREPVKNDYMPNVDAEGNCRPVGAAYCMQLHSEFGNHFGNQWFPIPVPVPATLCSLFLSVTY